MQCPVCGVELEAHEFKYIGNGKRLCPVCKSVLKVGYLCPVCTSHDSVVLGTHIAKKSFPGFVRNIRGLFIAELTCLNCGYHASFREFARILYHREVYSIMEQVGRKV